MTTLNQNFPFSDLTLIPRSEVCRRSNLGRSTSYLVVEEGLLTPPISNAGRSKVWPAYEIDAINAAKIAGKSEDEIRQLVKDLLAYRPKVFDLLPGFAA